MPHLPESARLWLDRVAPEILDMVLLAGVRAAFALSNGTYGRPRLSRELRDQGLAVGR